MAIFTEFINFIVPRKIIEEKYPGGWSQCLKDHEELIGGRVYFDDHLFHDGSMNGIDMTNLLERWGALGFECVGERAGQKYWKDVCVYSGVFRRSGMACDWLEEDQDTSSVYLKGSEKGQIIGSDRYMEYMKDKK